MVMITLVSVERVAEVGKTVFWRFKDTEDKTHSAWDESISKIITKNLGQPQNLILKVSPDGKYSNIRGIEIGTEETAPEAEKITSTPTANKSTPRSSNAITATELVRYAVKLNKTYNITHSMNFNKACEEVWKEYSSFLEKLE